MYIPFALIGLFYGPSRLSGNNGTYFEIDHLILILNIVKSGYFVNFGLKNIFFFNEKNETLWHFLNINFGPQNRQIL